MLLFIFCSFWVAFLLVFFWRRLVASLEFEIGGGGQARAHAELFVELLRMTQVAYNACACASIFSSFFVPRTYFSCVCIYTYVPKSICIRCTLTKTLPTLPVGRTAWRQFEVCSFCGCTIARTPIINRHESSSLFLGLFHFLLPLSSNLESVKFHVDVWSDCGIFRLISRSFNIKPKVKWG